ncbi:putative Ig domain-containing protein [Pedobacter aquatilis]|uniref:Ig-like domain-containing protein n=1 Tax=Pedobacter aquatilis TaxID=351343 RepID=UPI0025B40D27|nr:putative Ig domain-containing protein [Pedobacter aquatilis]MDN3588559.1 putative Ig domain-containing protein [Pedobacter aquatilis]
MRNTPSGDMNFSLLKQKIKPNNADMMKNSTPLSRFGKIPLIQIFLIVLSITVISLKSYGQSKIYANSVSSVSGNGQSSLLGCGTLGLSGCFTTPTVDNPNNAITADETTFATVKSSGGLAVGIGAYTGEIELQFPTTLAAGTVAYVRIDADPTLLNQLLAGNLGNLLSSVVGGVALGNHSIDVGARNASGATVLSGSSVNGFTSSNLRLVRDANGYFYVAIRPTQDYNKVFVRDVTSALLLGTLNNTKVYNAFYTSGTDACAQTFATSFEGNGLTLDALGLGKAGVTNPSFAIDANQTNYAELSLGALGVAGSISQNFYFNTLSNTSDEINLRIGASGNLVNAGVLSRLSITAYNGNNQVFNQSAGNLLSVDLLNALGSGQPVTIPFSPGVAFDRVQVTLSSLLNVNLTQTILIYGLTRTAARPTFVAPSSNVVNACFNSAATLSATTLSTNDLRWYDVAEGGTVLATTAFNGTFTTPALTANKIYYVAARRIGCIEESVRVPITITVNPTIVFNTTVLANATVGFQYSKQIDLATGGTPTFSYALASGSSLPAGLSLSANGTISGIPTSAGNFSFSIVATDSRGCSVTVSYNLDITDALVLTPGTLPDGITGSLYPNQIIPAATGGTQPYIYSATNLPPGLIFEPTTREITGTPTTVGTYTVPVTVIDANGNSVTSAYIIKVIDPLVLPAATLASGVTGRVYTPQIIPSAIGGVGPYSYAASGLPSGLTFNPATREITGTPTSSGTFTIPVIVTDAEGRNSTTNYIITVTDPLLLPSAVLANGNVGTTYPTQVIPSATGGVGAYTYVATGLPPGLTFNPATREITGNPTQAGNYSVSVTVTDAQGNTANNLYPLSVIGVLTLPTASLPSGTVGVVYPTQTLPAVTGGTAPYTYVASNLPPGLIFNTATREISGTPTLGGTFAVSLTGTDAIGNVVNTDYSIVVNVNQPVVTSVSVCAGSAATLNVSNLQAGVTYNWYASTGNTPLATNNNGVFTTPALTSNTTFYVEAISGTATSARIAVNVTINPSASPAIITTNNQVINSGQTTTLSATADTGNTIRWFATQTDGTELATGSNFTTPALTTTTTFYVETVNASGCPSNVRVPVTVTVITGGSNTICNAAGTQNSGITGICILCGISGPGNSTDANPNNFTRITLAVGALSTGFQQLIFNTAGTATDSVRLDLGLPTGLLDLSLLGNITVNVMNGNTVVSSYPLNSSLLRLALLGGSRFQAILPANGPFDRVEVRVGGLVSAVTSLDIYGATIVYPSPTITSGTQTICAGTSVSLSATANGGTTLRWFDAPTGGNILASGETFTTPSLTATTIYYIEVSRGNCTNTARIPVVVTVIPAISIPVLAPVANACIGSSATLSVSNPDPSLTYNWYDSDTGGTPIFTGSVFTTPVLTSNITYYVEAANGICVSSSRVAAIITVNPTPAIPVVTASSLSVPSGQTATLSATSSETNITFNWYDSANGTSPVFTGATFVTPPIISNTSFYVESVSSSGCPSASRVQVTITISGTGTPVIVPCEVASTQSNGFSGITLGAGVVNPNLAIDNDAQTASTLVLPVGVAGASVYQNLSFPGVSRVGDTLRVLISSPGRILSLGVLSSVQITTYLNGVSNNNPLSLNDALLNVQLLSGNTQALITLIPSVVFDGAELRLNSGVASALSSINLNYMQRTQLAPEVVSSSIAVCLGNTATLQVANPVAGLIYRWFDSNQNALADGNTYTTPAITAGTQYFVARVSSTGCVSAKTAVNVTLSAPPATPELLSSTINACLGSQVTLQIKNPIPGVIYRWYNSSNVSAGSDGPTLIVTAAANTTYTVEAVNSCGTSVTRATATLNVGATPDAPIVSSTSVTIISGNTATLTATSSIVGSTIRWYSDAAFTNLVSSDAVFTTPILTSSTNYYVRNETSLCGNSAAVIVAVNVIPATPGTTDCGTATVALADGFTSLGIGSGVSNTAAAVDTDINSASTLFITAGAANAYVFQRVGFAGGLSNIGDTLRVKISSPANLLSAAVLPRITLTTYNNLTSNADEITLSSQLLKLELASNGSEAILSFVPTKQFSGLEIRLYSGIVGALTSVNLNYAQRLITSPEVSSVTATACLGSSALLTVNNPKPNTTYRWYQDNVFKNTGTTYLTDATLPIGNHNFFVTATGNNGCESPKVGVVVTITAPPANPVIASVNPVNVCINNSTTINVQAVPGVIYNWYDAPVGGNLLVSNSGTFITSASLAPGSYTYYVEAASISGCANTTRTAVLVNVNQNASASDVIISGNTSLCDAGITTLTASSTTVTNPIFTWYSDAALTNQVSVGSTFTTPQITAATTYYVTVNGTNRCANTVGNAAVINININPSSTAADVNVAGNNSICSGSSASLTASSTTVINPVFTWYNDAALTSVAFSGATFNTPSLLAETTYYVTVKGTNKCENEVGDSRAITVRASRISTAADINVTGLNSICRNVSASLSASSTTVTNPVFTWYNDAALTSVAFVGASFNTTPLINTTTYYVTVKGDNSCENASGSAAVVTVTVKDYATAADITVNNANVCSGSSTTLMASSLTVTQPVFTWYSDASLTVPVFTGPTYNITAVTSTTILYVTVKGSNKCENAAVDAKVVTVTVNPLATTTDIIVSGTTAVCTGNPAVLTASSTSVTNPVFTWYSDAALTNISYVGSSFTTPSLNTNTTYYVTVKGDNKCENAVGNARVVTITTSPVPTSPVISNTGTTICSGDATTLNIQNPQAGITYEWYNSATGGNLLFSGTSFTTPILTANTTYYVQAVGAAGCANSTGRTMVAVIVNARPGTTSVASSSVSVCSGSSTVLNVTNAQSDYTYNWYNAATGGNILGSGSSFNTGAVNTNTVFYVEAVSGNCVSATRTQVNVTVLPVPLAPAQVSAASNTICAGSAATLSVVNPDPTLTYSWFTAGSGGTSIGQGTTITTPVITSTTIFYVESINASGCKSTIRTPITITVLPVLAAPVVRVETTTANSISFAWNAVTGATGYEISLNNGLTWQQPSEGANATRHLVIGLKPDQSVTIVVRATGQIACQTSANSTALTAKAANPLGNEIYIPNAFTPNNDGKNDIFLVYGTTIASVKMNIYTQWGQLIYQVDSTTTGWDGTYRGVPQPSGVYVYMIEVISSDGTKVMKKGTITLIR